MPALTSSSPASQPARTNLKPYSADIQLSTLNVGVDNIHFDVFLSPRFVEFSSSYLLDLIRQTSNLPLLTGVDSHPFKNPEHGAFRRMLSELLQAGVTRAKFEKNIELDLLLRLSVLKFLTQEISNQFANLILEGKEWIRHRGAHFEHSEQGHVMKARLAGLQTDRRNVYRQVGQHVYQIVLEVDESVLAKSRRALFREESSESYEMLRDRLVFVEGGKDDILYLEQYVLLGNYQRDQDRMENIDQLLLDFLRTFVVAGDQEGDEAGAAWNAHKALVDAALHTRAELARLEEERNALLLRVKRKEGLLARLLGGAGGANARAQLADVERRHKHMQQRLDELGPRLEAAKQRAQFLTQQFQSRLDDYLNWPENSRRLFDPTWTDDEGGGKEATQIRAKLLDEWMSWLEQRDLLVHIAASYELRSLFRDYCPPVHLQQLKKALVFREEMKHVEDILKQFPARHFSLQRIEDLARKLRRIPREEVRALAVRFVEDFMRLRRDLRDYRLLSAGMERINLIRTERTRELSRLNHSLYEFLLPDEARPADDRVVAHAIIKADVRDSTQITRDLLARGLNPASHLSLNLYEPVKRILERYGAAKVFIEGDAIVLAIFETESNRSHQRAVAKACLLARHILGVSQAYNDRAQASDLPRLELGVGIAYQASPPTYWVDADSRIMISRALNLSDRLSSCSKMARRVLAKHKSLFRLFLFQTVMQGAAEEELDEFLIRFNLNGVELNEEGFQKLSEEISMNAVETKCDMPWGRDLVTFYFGEVPAGEALEPIVIRKGFVRQLLPDGKIGASGTHPYYEVCINPKIFDLIEALERHGVHKA